MPKQAESQLLSLTPTRWRPVKVKALSKEEKPIVRNSMQITKGYIEKIDLKKENIN